MGGQTKVLGKSKLANIRQKATRETWFRESADESVSGRHSIPSSKTLKKKIHKWQQIENAIKSLSDGNLPTEAAGEVEAVSRSSS